MSENMSTISVASDLNSWVLFPNKANDAVYLVGSIEMDKYLVVPAQRYPLVMKILERLREGHSPEQIETALRDEGFIVNVQEFCELLARKNLIKSEPPLINNNAELSPTNARWGSLFGHLRALSWQIFSIKLDKYNTILQKFAPFTLGLIFLATLFSSLLLILNNWGSITKIRLLIYQLIHSREIIWLTLVNMMLIPLFVFFHESAHAVVASYGGVYPRKLSFRMYLLAVPYFSLQIPGLYTLPVRIRFLAIAVGPIIDLFFGNLFLLLATKLDSALSPWFAFIAFCNYGRFFYNILPVLPITDGYTLLSQAVFREIDIRGHASREFHRWYKHMSHNFHGKYVIFFVINVCLASLIIISAIFELNIIILNLVRKFGLNISGTTWWVLLSFVLLDSCFLYMARHRLRVLIGA